MKEIESTVLPHQLPPDTLLASRYRLIRVLGEGGFGITYEGWDETLQMRVAVKEYFLRAFVTRHQRESKDITIPGGESMTAFEKGKAAFLNEARTLAQFQQDPNIISVTNFFEENRTAYIVMEFLDGQDLKDLLAERGTLSFRETLDLLQPIMKSLSILHEHGLIHRDISPSNIRILPNGTAKLMDFGASREIDTVSDASRSICLKPGYSPEEQYRSRGALGPWTDVYALSATMYHMLVGFPPDDSLQRILLDEVKKPSELGVKIPADAEAALMRGLAVQSKDRYQSIREMAEALTATPEREDPVSKPVEKPDRLPLTALIPFAGLLCPFEMSRRTGQKRFARIGKVFLIGFGLVYLLLVFLVLNTAANVSYYDADSYYSIGSSWFIQLLIALILWFVLYLIRVIYTFVVRKDYIRYRSAYLKKHPPVDLSETEKAAGGKPVGWRILACIPYIFGFAGIYIGKRSRQRALSALGIVSAAVIHLSTFCMLEGSLASNFTYETRIVLQIILTNCYAAFYLLSIILYAWNLIRSFYEYPRFCEQECRFRAEAFAAYPNLNNRKWRAENSRWQIWTWIPLLAGVGLIIAGKRVKRRDITRKGILMLLANAAIVIIISFSVKEALILYSNRIISTICQMIAAAAILLLVLLWEIGIYLGVSDRFPILLAIAKDLGPYYSRAEKEIAEMN